VNLGPGQSRFVVLHLTPSDLAYYNSTQGQWTVAPGRYTVMVGTSSAELGHTATFNVSRAGHVG
jgi:beta-glucosidase